MQSDLSQTLQTPKRGKGWAYGFIALLILLLALFTAGWYWAAGQLDSQVNGMRKQLADAGKVLECPEQIVRGYPFRLGVFCKDVAYADPISGITVKAGQLRSAAQLYNPGKIVAELDAPLDVTVPGLAPMTLDWSNLKTSSVLSTGGLQRASLVIDKMQISANDAGLKSPIGTANQLQMHGKRSEDNAENLDLAFLLDQWLVSDGGTNTIQPMNFSLDVQLEEIANEVQQGADLINVLKEKGGKGTLRNLQLTTEDGGLLNISGPVKIDTKGRVSGEISISLEEPQKLINYASGVFPPLAIMLSEAMPFVEGFSIEENGKKIIRDLKISADKGVMTLGFFPIGEIPPLF